LKRPSPWRALGGERLLAIPPWIELRRESWQLPDGRQIDDYYRLDLPPYAVIAALTPARELVAERHFRPGAGAVTLALPSGYLDPGEEPLAAARRELLEETGYEATDWSTLGRFVVDGNRGCGVAHLFVARGARKVRDPDSKDLAEMAIELVAVPAFLDAIRRGESAELATAAAVALAASELT
jgi:ADP-ribose pyrophosphatase